MNRFARVQQLLGEEAFKKIRASRIAIFGLGGVGSYVCENLARSGVGTLRLIDVDTTGITNMNRQLLALGSTLGEAKVASARDRILDINPECHVEVWQVLASAENLQDLLTPEVDIIVDAIDSITSKVALIKYAVDRAIPVITSLGAGGRTDLSQIRRGDISESRNCRLAKVLRKMLHRVGIYEGVRCVYSLEPARNQLPFRPEDADPPKENCRMIPPIGTMPYLPAAFGLHVVQEVMEKILGLQIHQSYQ